ncbi:MAG: DUF2339 domain-containing protein, partial [Candidatus Acidiferrales bacterium]
MNAFTLLALSGFDSEVLLLLLFLVVVLLAAPILAIAAWVRVRRLERRGPEALDAITVRQNALEQRLADVERALTSAPAARPASVPPSGTTAGRPPAPPQPAAAPSPPPPIQVTPVATAPAPPSPPAPPPKATPSVIPEIPPPSPPPPRPTTAGLDMESLIGGRWLNRIGITALLLAASFLLKYAYDNDWIGPTGIVALEMLAGAALVAWSQWLLARGYKYFSEGIAGLGAGVLYFSLYSAWDLYHLVLQGVAFGGMVVVTAAMTAIALGRNSQRIALLALIGGLATPMLLSTG